MHKITDGLPHYRFESLTDLTHGVFTRQGGVSHAPFDSLNLGGTLGDDVDAVRCNHTLIYDALNIDPARTVTVWMVHGADTIMAHEPVQGRRWLAQADAIITDQPGLALVMRYGDCTPILAYDPRRRAIGIAHAGWQGTVKGMAYNLIRAMQQAYGSRPADILTGIGPAISVDRYQVGEEVVEAARAHFGTVDDLFRRDPADGTAYFDMWRANARDLQRAGVLPEHIEVSGMCTATRTDEFYSHRAEKGKTGRFGVVMAL